MGFPTSPDTPSAGAFSHLIPETNYVDLYCRFSTDGSTFDSSSLYVSSGQELNSGGAVNYGQAIGSPTTQFTLRNAAAVSSDANYGVCGTWELDGPNSAIYKRLRWKASYANNGVTAMQNNHGNGTYKSATAVVGMQWRFSGGDIASGTVRVYGVAKS